MTQEQLKEKMELLEDLMKQKISQANALRESIKPVEAYNAAIKEITKKVEDIILPKKLESLDMLSKQKMGGEFYRFLIEIIDQLADVVLSSRQDSEKLLLARQSEFNFVAQEYNRLKEIQDKLSSSARPNEQQAAAEKKEEQKAEYVRPDQNPNTRLGKASLDLQQRRKAGKSSGEE